MFKIKACEKITTGICLTFRGLFFEHNADIGQKEHFWMDTNWKLISLNGYKLYEWRANNVMGVALCDNFFLPIILDSN